jgi:hypothetical protein
MEAFSTFDSWEHAGRGGRFHWVAWALGILHEPCDLENMKPPSSFGVANNQVGK